MIRTLKDYKNNSHTNSYIAALLNPCCHTVILYRLSNKLYRLRLNLLAKLIWFINRIIFNVDIDYRANIGKGFILVHGLGVVIGCNVVIGKNVKVYQGVTLGGNGKKRMLDGKEITQPIIKDECIIYTNACLFGPIIIENKCIVKACEIVVEDRIYKERI